MFTVSLPPIPEGGNKAHLSLTPAAHQLPDAGLRPAPRERATAPDFERGCSPENGCGLDPAAQENPGAPGAR